MKSISNNNILIHISTIVFFIACETCVIFLWGTTASIEDFAMFYTLEITFFYLSTYFAIPKYTVVSNYFAKGAVILAWIMLFNILAALLIIGQYRTHNLAISSKGLILHFIKNAFRLSYLFLLSFAFWYARNTIRKEKQARENEKKLFELREKESRLEVAFLRTQINPHLMFNALSGIQANLIETAPEAAETIIILSELIEAALKGSDPESQHTLGDEISIVNKIVELQQHLGKKNFKMNIDVKDEDQKQEFPPHLLTTIVENVFKHGSFGDEKIPALITLYSKNGNVTLITKNKIAESPSHISYNIGLKNLRSRLDKHYYNRYSITVDTENNLYCLTLNLNRYETEN